MKPLYLWEVSSEVIHTKYIFTDVGVSNDQGMGKKGMRILILKSTNSFVYFLIYWNFTREFSSRISEDI